MSRIIVQHQHSDFPSPPHVSPSDLWRICRRRRRTMVIWTVLAATATTMIVLWWPRSYQSNAQLLVRMGRESVMLDPTATTGQTLNLHRTRESEINSVIQILKSDQVAQQVVKRFDFAEVSRGKRAGDAEESVNPLSLLRSVKSRATGWLSSLDPLSDRERAVRKFKNSLEVTAPLNSNVISIEYRARSPQFAHDVAKVATDVFLDEHLRLNRTVGSYEFYLGQEREVRQQLSDALAALRDAKTKTGLASVEHHQEALEQRLATLHEWEATNRTELAASTAKADQLRHIVAKTPIETTTESVTGVGNDASEGMRQQLYELQIQEGELTAKYTGEHPKIVSVRRQREEAEKILAEQPDDRTQKRVGLNPVRQQMDIDLMTETALISSLQSREKALALELAALKEQLVTLNAHEVDIARLQTEVDLARLKYQVVTEKLEQSRIVQALEENEITSVNMVQPATFEEKPVSPKVGLTILLGLAAAVGGSLGLAITAEYFDRSDSPPPRVEKEVAAPVLVSIPRENESSVEGATAASPS